MSDKPKISSYKNPLPPHDQVRRKIQKERQIYWKFQEIPIIYSKSSWWKVKHFLIRANEIRNKTQTVEMHENCHYVWNRAGSNIHRFLYILPDAEVLEISRKKIEIKLLLRSNNIRKLRRAALERKTHSKVLWRSVMHSHHVLSDFPKRCRSLTHWPCKIARWSSIWTSSINSYSRQLIIVDSENKDCKQ